jgi:hypothetical protein
LKIIFTSAFLQLRELAKHQNDLFGKEGWRGTCQPVIIVRNEASPESNQIIFGTQTLFASVPALEAGS